MYSYTPIHGLYIKFDVSPGLWAGDDWGWLGMGGEAGDGSYVIEITYRKLIKFSLVLMGISSRAGDGWGWGG